MGAKIDSNSTSYYDYHLALSFDFEEPDQCVWICELARKTNRKDQQGDQIFEWKDENSVCCQSQTKTRVLEDRKRLGLVVFRVGAGVLELADIHYWCEQLNISRDSNPDLPVCHFWIQSLASKLNLPNQQILELLSKGNFILQSRARIFLQAARGAETGSMYMQSYLGTCMHIQASKLILSIL